MAALRGGIKTVLIPSDNMKDLAEVPENVTRELKIIPISQIDDIFKEALVESLVPIEWNPEDEDIASRASSSPDDDLSGMTAH